MGALSYRFKIKKSDRPCPDCGAALVKRTSGMIHPLMWRTSLFCTNPDCGANFTGSDEITHRLSPPREPNPNISIPFAPVEIRRHVLRWLEFIDDEKQTDMFDQLESEEQ